MRKLLFSLTALIFAFGVLAMKGASPDNQRFTQQVVQGIDLSNSFNFTADAGKIGKVVYSTSTQSQIPAPKVTENGKDIYYVDASENPTSFVVTPAAGNGIAGLTDSKGKAMTYNVDRTTISLASYSPTYTAGEVFNFVIDKMSNVRTGRLNITIDDPTDVLVYTRSTYSEMRAYKAADFQNNALVIEYDPVTESRWVITTVNAGDLSRAVLDGNVLPREKGFVYTSMTTMTLHEYFHLVFNGGGEHNANVRMKYPDFNIPLTVKVENTNGNETNQSYLDKQIAYVRVNNVLIPREEWEGKQFMVKNGSEVVVGPVSNNAPTWWLDSRYLNGEKVTSNLNRIDGETDDPQTIVYKGYLDNAWRFKVICDKFDVVKMSHSGREFTPLTAKETTGEATFSTMGGTVKLEAIAESGYVISEIKLNGEPVELNSYGRNEVDFKTQDAVIEVSVEPYVRDKQMSLYIDMDKRGALDVILSPEKFMEKRVTLEEGRQTLMYNPKDLPLDITIGAPIVFVNGVRVNADADGYYLANYQEGQEVRIYGTYKPPCLVTYEPFPSSVNATIYHDDVQVEPGQTYTLSAGTKIKVVPTKGTNLVLQVGPNKFVEKSDDGAFYYTPTSACVISLHPRNPKITVSCASNYNNIKVVDTRNSLNQFDLTGSSTSISLPYYEDATTYSLEFTDPTNTYVVSNVKANPSTGFSYNSNTHVATGVKDGMTLTLTVEVNQKPYSLDIMVYPEDNQSSYGWTYDAATGYFMEMGAPLDIETGLYVSSEKITPDNDYNYSYYSVKPTYDDGEGEYPEPEMPPMPPGMVKGKKLKFGRNNYIDNVEYTFDESAFPITITNKNGRNMSAVLFFEDATGSYNYDTQFIVLTNEDDNNSYVISSPDELKKLHIYWTNSYEPEKSYVTINSNGANFKYQIDQRTPVMLNEGDKVEDYLFGGSSIKFIPVEGNPITEINRDGTNYLDKDEETGTYIEHYSVWDVQSNYSVTYNVTGQKLYITFNPYTDLGTAGIIIEDDNFTDKSIDKLYWEGKAVDNIVIKCGIDSYQIVKVTTDTGVELPFNIYTGEISGLLQYVDNEYNITLNIELEEYKREKTLKIEYPDNFTNITPQFVLSPEGAMQQATYLEKKGSPTTVKFNDQDAPFSLTNAKYMVSPKVYYSNVYLNNEKLAFDNTTKTYAFPTYVPDNSVLRILNSQISDVNVVYDIEEDGLVDVTVDGRPVTSTSTQMVTPYTATIKVTPKEGNIYEYTVQYNKGQGFVNFPAEGITLSSAYPSLTVKVAKTYNTITVNTDAAVALDKLSITGQGVSYPLTSGNNVISVPTHVKELTIVTSEPDRYVEVTASAGMNFNKDKGLLTALATGTININIADVVRDKETVLYLDGDEMLDGTIVLGSGKVIEKSQGLEVGYQHINFGSDDLPIVYRVAASRADGGYNDVETEMLPEVYVNGTKVEFSAEAGGFILPAEAFEGENTPVIKVYPPTEAGAPQVNKLNVTYIVENGISFTATEDFATEITEVGTHEVLPGTKITLTAAADNGDAIYVEIGEERITPVDGKYTITIGKTDMTIAVKREKHTLTFTSEEWRSIRISGGGLEYPMYDVESTLEFPYSTTELKVFSSVENRQVVAVNDAAGNALPFNTTTGILTGFEGKQMNIVLSDFTRDVNLMVYVEEEEDVVITDLVLSEGTVREKVITLNPGYQTIAINMADLPLAVKTVAKVTVPAKVYLNNELISFNETDGLYEFPDELPENPIVKIYAQEVPTISLNYSIKASKYDVVVWHDRQSDLPVDTKQMHEVLPGTEISISVTEIGTQPSATLFAAKPMEEASETKPFTVSVNGAEINPDENGVYTVKVTKEHTAGLSVNITQADSTSGLEEVFADGKPVDIYNLNGVLIKKNANADAFRSLPTGTYIVGGTKMFKR